MELLLGAGSNRTKKVRSAANAEWVELVTLDFNADHKPDVVHDLTKLPWPFEDDQFDEVHAYEVMEHIGQQGDYQAFFAQWSEIYRILKPDGIFAGTSPAYDSAWAWGDPGHTRIVSEQSLIFLNQPAYAQVGRTPMSDYRWIYEADFEGLHFDTKDGTLVYVLQAIKPSRKTTLPLPAA